MFDRSLVDSWCPHGVELRRVFRREPDLAFEEVETAGKIMTELDRLGVPYPYQGEGGGARVILLRRCETLGLVPPPPAPGSLSPPSRGQSVSL